MQRRLNKRNILSIVDSRAGSSLSEDIPTNEPQPSTKTNHNENTQNFCPYNNEEDITKYNVLIEQYILTRKHLENLRQKLYNVGINPDNY